MNNAYVGHQSQQDMFKAVGRNYWEKNWEQKISKKPLSLLNVFNSDATAVLSSALRKTFSPTVVEIGFAPGKYLDYFEKHFHGKCHGYDYSESGCREARQFLSTQGSKVLVHCQDVLTSPPDPTHRAQLVYSLGVVEHFADPKEMVRAHLAPLADDGVAIIILPNYQGMNHWIQARLNPENLTIHNLDSMTKAFWDRHAQSFPEYQFITKTAGRFNPWMFSFRHYGVAGFMFQLGLNFVSLVLRKQCKIWASMFVIEIRKR